MIRCFLSALVAFFVMAVSAANVGVTVNGVDVSQGSGDGWSYTNKTLAISGAGPFTLSGTNTAGTVLVKVTSSSTVVLSNLVLKVSTGSSCMFQVAPSVEVDLRLFGDSQLKSGTGSPGLLIPDGAVVVIDEAIAGEGGMLRVSGGDSAPGIGAKPRLTAGTLIVRSGQIVTSGHGYGAGIGGGFYGRSGPVTIQGGTIAANRGDGAENDIGGDGESEEDNNAVTITGGSLNASVVRDAPRDSQGNFVHCVTVTGLVAQAVVTLSGLGDYGTNGIYADAAGRVYLWLTNGVHAFVANGTRYRAAVNGPVTAEILGAQIPVGVTVDGVDLVAGTGEGWVWDDIARRVSLTVAGSYAVSGSNTLNSLTISGLAGVRTTYRDFTSEQVVLEGPIEVAGGTVAANADGPVAITGGSVKLDAFTCDPSNGVARVWCVTVTNLPPNAAVTVTGLADYGVDGIVADAEGKIYLWLPDGDRIFSVDGVRVRAIVEGADVFATSVADVPLVGVTVNGIDVAYGSGPGWSYEEPALTISGTEPLVLSGTNENGRVQVFVYDATVCISNLVLSSATASPFTVSNVVQLMVVGMNVLTSGDGAGLTVSEHSFLTINSTSAMGMLQASGGNSYPGIGGAYEEFVGEVGISGGTIFSTGSGSGRRKSPDIGGDALGHNAELDPVITITGGSIRAETIAQAPVNSRNEPVYCVTVTNLAPNAAVALTGLADYGVDGIVADAEGKIYLWLPDGAYAFNAGGVGYTATVDGGPVTATAGAAVVAGPTELRIVSFGVGNGVATLALATDLDAAAETAWLSASTFEVVFQGEPGGAETVLAHTRGGAVFTATLPDGEPRGFLRVRQRK